MGRINQYYSAGAFTDLKIQGTIESRQIVAKIKRERPTPRVSVCGLAAESDRAYLSEKAITEGKSLSSIDDSLQEFAKKRAELAGEQLVSQHGITDKRIFICKPENDKNAKTKPRAELIF